MAAAVHSSSSWRRYARRAAIAACTVGALAALAWALDRPVHVISMDGSFQRVSPGQIEKRRRALCPAGLHVGESRPIQRAVQAVPWVDAGARAAPLAEQPARHGDRAGRRGALGRIGSAQYARRTVRTRRGPRAAGIAAA